MAVVDHETGKKCSCQKSGGVELNQTASDSSADDACRVVALPNTEPNQIVGTCMGEWVRTNYFGQFGEKRISAYTSKEDCINKVREEC